MNFCRDLINEQDSEVERAVVERSKLEVRPYSSFQVSEVKWFSMTRAVSDITSCDNTNSTPLLTSTRVTAPDHTTQLAVDVQAVAESSCVPRKCLDRIWLKAGELLSTENAIVPAPIVTSGRFMMCYSGPKQHLVTEKKNGSFFCDEHCSNWNAFGICSHSVAVTNLCGKLSEFVAFFKKTRKSPALSGFVQAGINKDVNKHKLCLRGEDVKEHKLLENARLHNFIGLSEQMPITCISEMNLFDPSIGLQTNVQMPSV